MGHPFCEGRDFVKGNSEGEMRPLRAPGLRGGRGLRSAVQSPAVGLESDVHTCGHVCGGTRVWVGKFGHQKRTGYLVGQTVPQ